MLIVRYLLKRLVIILIPCMWAASFNAFSDEFSELLKQNNFIGYPVPAYDHSDWRKANNSLVTYYVTDSNGTVTINTRRSSVQPLLTYAAENIRYQGTNNGEWGGKLMAIFRNGTNKVLINDNIVSIIPYQPKLLESTGNNASDENTKAALYVFTGLAHLGMSSGAIFAIREFDKNPSISRQTLLPDAPYVIIPDKNNNDGTRFFIIGASTALSRWLV